LLVLGDNVTTDHISPIGRIQPDTPAAAYLRSTGAAEGSFGSYGDRRANHHVMLRARSTTRDWKTAWPVYRATEPSGRRGGMRDP
jgi:aconitase A